MRISDWSSDVCSSDLRSAILIEQQTPPETPPTPRLPRIEQQRIRPAPDSTNIINRAVTGEEARPGLLPFGTIFEDASRSRSEKHTSELQSLMRNSYAVFCLKQKKLIKHTSLIHT